MWKYIRKYLLFAVIAALFMVGEVMMDLVQPQLMSQIVDDGVLGLDNNGVGSLDIIWSMGIRMTIARAVRRLLRFNEQRVCTSFGAEYRKRNTQGLL